jgi:class 3 adenylate cyclase
MVKQTGDGSLAVFPLASQAVRAAAALRTSLEAIDVVVRQGIHVGELVEREGDVAGVAVHVAARVMALAGPGEVVTTATVRLTADTDRTRFEPRGSADLRGVDGTWDLFTLLDAAPALDGRGAAPAT